VHGKGYSSAIGVFGESSSGMGVRGDSNSGIGVSGTSSSNNGVRGTTASTTSAGVSGINPSSGPGVYGFSLSGIGVRGLGGDTGVTGEGSGIGVRGDSSMPVDELSVAFYAALGTTLKQRFAGWTVFLFTADLTLPRLLRLKEARKTPFFNGALECRLFRFDMVAGYNRREEAKPKGL